MVKEFIEYIRVFCFSDTTDAEDYKMMRNDNKYDMTLLSENWDVAGRYRGVFMIREKIAAKKDEDQ